MLPILIRFDSSDSYEVFGRIIDAEWQELARTHQGVFMLVRGNIVPLILKRIGFIIGHSAIPIVCSLSRRCAGALLMRRQGEVFLDMME